LPKKQKTSLPPSLEQAKGLPVVSEKYRVLQTAGTGAGVTADKGERMCRLSPFDPPPSFGSPLPPLSLGHPQYSSATRLHKLSSPHCPIYPRLPAFNNGDDYFNSVGFLYKNN